MSHFVGRYAIRKADRLWELWRFDGRSWERRMQSAQWTFLMFMATGDPEYAKLYPQHKLAWDLHVRWQP